MLHCKVLLDCFAPLAMTSPNAAHLPRHCEEGLSPTRQSRNKKGGPKPAFSKRKERCLLPPNLLRDLHNKTQLRPLLFFRQRIAFLS